MSIYVETVIRGSIDEIWERTQNPAFHKQWDLRFSDIRYLPRPDSSQPQRFCYSTRIGFGITIHGTGETVGERETPDGRRTSALKFWSDDPKSLIVSGSGYWQYLPEEHGVRFLTWYDYQTRFGFAGRMFDRLVFRPLMGWATAWSFDRLRLWIEHGRDPAAALHQRLIYSLGLFGALFGFTYALQEARKRSVIGAIIAAAITAIISLALPSPAHIPSARRCRRRPRPKDVTPTH